MFGLVQVHFFAIIHYFRLYIEEEFAFVVTISKAKFAFVVTISKALLFFAPLFGKS